MFSTQDTQKVHSYEHIRASIEFGGSGVSQFSQPGFNFSIPTYYQRHSISAIQHSMVHRARRGDKLAHPPKAALALIYNS